MTDWLGYALRDFLMFGPEVYWRLFALHNQALWPLPAFAVAVGIAILLLMRSGDGSRHRAICLLTALSWFGAAHFLATRYAQVNWPMVYAAWAFGAQAALIALFALHGARKPARPAGTLTRRIAVAIVAYAVILQPLVAPLIGRPLAQAEVYGLAPDPTALASLGLLLVLGRGLWRAMLSIIPALWCVVSATTLFTLGAAQGWFLVVALGIWGMAMIHQALRVKRCA